MTERSSGPSGEGSRGVVGEQRLSLSAQTRLGRILALDRPLLDVTLDQLRTFIVVRETGSALKVAQTLGRELSSIQKQLDTLCPAPR